LLCNPGNNSKSSRSNATDTSSSTFGSKGSSFSVPPTPRTEKEILQSTNLRKFTFSELKSSTRNFRTDSLLGEGGFGSVFKGWMDERTFAPVKPGTGMIVAVKKLKLDSFQGHKEWLVGDYQFVAVPVVPVWTEDLVGGFNLFLPKNNCRLRSITWGSYHTPTL
jgi:hypothetical protein